MSEMKTLAHMRADKEALAKELALAEDEMKQGPISQTRGEEIERKVEEMMALQKHIDRHDRVSNLVADEAKRVHNPVMPSTKHGGARDRLTTTPGHLFVESDAFGTFKATGKQGWSSKVDVKSVTTRQVGLSGKAAADFRARIESKAFDAADLSDVGTDAIIPAQRDPEVVRFEEPEILTIRDVLNVAPTTGDSIRFVRHTVTERAAASQNPRRGGLKDYLRVEFEPATVGVETIAVLSKIAEQDIDDSPRLVNYINGEMQLDVRQEEERQLLWGTGTNSEIAGLYSQGIPEYTRTTVGVSNETLIDVLRRMRTDLRKTRVIPNFVAVDPLDWEQIETEKGTDTHYLWGLITDLRGPRIWSLRVVESDAMEHPTDNSRRVLMGDGLRGATIYDRHQVRLAVGLVDDDFARNLRTLRAEERIALAVKRAYAFLWYGSAAAAS